MSAVEEPKLIGPRIPSPDEKPSPEASAAPSPHKFGWIAMLANGFEDEYNAEVHWITGDKDRMMLRKPEASAASEPTRGAEPLQTIREDRVCARCGATVSHDCGPAAPPTAQARPLSSYAFSQYGSDAKLYNGIHDLEQANERLEAELQRVTANRESAVASLEDQLASSRATVQRLEAELAEYAGWSPHQFTALLEEHRKLQAEHIVLDTRRYNVELARDQAREQRDNLVKALRKVDGMVVSSFDGPRGGPAHQIHAYLQSTLAALKEERG